MATFAYLLFDKSDQKLTVTYYSDKSTYMVKQTFNASNNVVPKSEPTDKTSPDGKNYYRTNFPNGNFSVTGVRKGVSDAEGDYVIKTDAKVTVTTYKKVENIETGKMEWKSEGTNTDRGYNLHAGKLNFSDWLSQTLGCLRVEQDTAKELFEVYKKHIEPSKGTMTGTVQE